MAYTKQQWVDNTTPVDAAHMNHIEDGIGDISEETRIDTRNRVGWYNGNNEKNIDNYCTNDFCGVWLMQLSYATSGTIPPMRDSTQGILFVKKMNGTYYYQKFVALNGEAYWRRYKIADGTWNEWAKAIHSTLAMSNNLTGASERNGWTSLESATDLNTIVTPGVYYCAGNAVAATMINCPVSDAFKLVVEYSNGTNVRLRQIVTRSVAETGAIPPSEVYVRATGSTGSSWTDWVKQPTREEVDYLQNNGVKNLFGPLYTAPLSRNSQGVDYTFDNDGSVTAVGTATGASSFINCAIVSGKFSVPKGVPLRLTGSDGNVNILVCYFEGTTTTKYAGTDSGNGVDFTIPNTATQTWLRVATPNGKTVNSKVYPMVTVRNIQDDTYQPYAMSNAKLTGKKGTFTTSNENVTITVTDVYQMGNMVFVRLYGTISTGVGNNDNLIGTISGVGLPQNATVIARNIIDLGETQIYQSGGYGYVSVAQDGKVYIKSGTHSTFKAFKINVFYSIL